MFFLWANVAIYIISYLYIYDKEITMDTVYYVDMASVIMTFVGYQVGAYLINEKQWNPKIILFLGASLGMVGFVVSSYSTSQVTFVLLYGATTGLGLGINYLVPFVCGWKYFPNNKGLVSGIISGAYGMGNVIFSYLSTSIVNPHGLDATIEINTDTVYFAEEVASRVPEMIRYLCVIWFFQIIFAIAFISIPPEDE